MAIKAQELMTENPWLGQFVAQLTHSFPSIRQVYLFGSRVRGDFRPDSDWDFAVYGGWDESFHLMCEIARHEDVAPGGQIVDMYVEEDGPTLIAVWGAQVPRVLPQELAQWKEGRDYILLLGNPVQARLGERIKSSQESG